MTEGEPYRIFVIEVTPLEVRVTRVPPTRRCSGTRRRSAKAGRRLGKLIVSSGRSHGPFKWPHAVPALHLEVVHKNALILGFCVRGDPGGDCQVLWSWRPRWRLSLMIHRQQMIRHHHGELGGSERACAPSDCALDVAGNLPERRSDTPRRLGGAAHEDELMLFETDAAFVVSERQPLREVVAHVLDDP